MSYSAMNLLLSRNLSPMHLPYFLIHYMPFLESFSMLLTRPLLLPAQVY